ncbi:hypothetical protein U728_3767 (plasmid) [Clostridium botulinum 202F]|nr:hypothetical protein U728_3767 [Clostridium botulinum 202F]KAI3344489.1 hypothetical protein CIT17_17090 [Clostridium botulinum]KON13510.1 hypothetical protein ACP50_05425 [Clostridium botulinum]MBY6987884.1 hypothetical protein [Clostridium botulinum]NFH01485.1 hypothetical protein [Clostridium botulinum]
MNIDINAIVNNKLKEMEENNTIEKVLEENIEKAIIKGIEGALDSYSLKHQIEDKVEKQVSEVVSEIGFTGYNGFIAEKIKMITEEVCRKDVAEKIQKTFNDILVIKRENIKLSEIFEKYRDYMNESTDEEDKYSLENFWVDIEESEYGWITYKMAREKPERSYYRDDENYIEFTVYPDRDDKKIGSMNTVYIGDKRLENTFKLGNMTEIESLITNIYYNKTPIIIDIEGDDDIETYFDIDN